MKHVAAHDSGPITLRFDDRDAFVEFMEPVPGSFAVCPNSSRFVAEMSLAQRHHADVFHIKIPDARLHSEGNRDWVSVTVPLAKGLCVGIDGRPTELHAGSAHILWPDDEFQFQTRHDTGRVLVANVDRSTCERTVSELGMDPLRTDALKSVVSLGSSSGAALYRRVEELWNWPHVCVGDDYSEIAVEEAGLALVNALISAAFPHAGNGDDHAPTNTVRRTEEYIEANLMNPVTLGDLAAAVQVRGETLCRAFRKRHNVGPIGYLRQRRLEAAHRMLLAADKECQRVTTVALQHGFVHLSQFAMQYRRMFGERPSDTLAR